MQVVAGSTTIPKAFRKAHAFLKAGKENREFIAYQAYRGRMAWPYSIPLETVVSYLRCRPVSSS